MIAADSGQAYPLLVKQWTHAMDMNERRPTFRRTCTNCMYMYDLQSHCRLGGPGRPNCRLGLGRKTTPMPAATPSAGSPPRHAVVDRALQYRLSLSPAAADPSETPPTRQQLDAELDLLAERDPRFKKMVAVNRVLTQPMERSEQEEAILHHVKANLDSCISSVDSGGGSSSVYDGQRSNRAGAAAAADLRRWQVLSSLIYYACIWFLGLQSGIIGPTLAGVADQLGEASGTALAAQFSFRSGGFLIGTLSVGAIFEASTKQHSTIALAAAGLALGLAVLPTVRDLQLYYLLWVPMGACMGYVDTGTNLLIMETWKGANAVPWMNLLHFMWGVGSFMAPLQVWSQPSPGQGLFWGGLGHYLTDVGLFCAVDVRFGRFIIPYRCSRRSVRRAAPPAAALPGDAAPDLSGGASRPTAQAKPVQSRRRQRWRRRWRGEREALAVGDHRGVWDLLLLRRAGGGLRKLPHAAIPITI